MLDRPNPAGRPVEGLTLRPGWESFVGAGPIPMRHGLTLGELGHWFVDHFKLDVDYRVIEMEGWRARRGARASAGPRTASGSTPAPTPPTSTWRAAYAGTVMLEGTTLSEGRGTTRPLELFGAPDIDARAVIAEMERAGAALAGRLRACAKCRSSRPSTSMSASCATASRSTPKGRSTTMRRSSRGGSRRWPSRRSAGSIPTIRCGAISPTNMSSASWRSTSSTAARPCANGSTATAAPGDLDALTIPDERDWEEQRKPYLLLLTHGVSPRVWLTKE